MLVKQVICRKGNMPHVASPICYVLRVKMLHLANQMFYMLPVKYFMLLVNHVTCQNSRFCHVSLAMHIAHTLIKYITRCQSNMLYFRTRTGIARQKSNKSHFADRKCHMLLLRYVACCLSNTSYLIIPRHHKWLERHDTCRWSKIWQFANKLDLISPVKHTTFC